MEIGQVSAQRVPNEGLHGSFVDLPVPGATMDAYSVHLKGWVLAKPAPARSLELLQNGRPVLTIPVDRDRPDVASAFSGVAGADRSGFEAAIGVVGLPSQFDLRLRAILENGIRLPFGRVQGSREKLPILKGEVIQPLMINTIGRSGSTWLAALLGAHPQIVAFSPFAHDARVATYWMSVLRDLSQPQSYRLQFNPQNLEDSNWWLGDPDVSLRTLADPRIDRWLGRGGVNSLARLCRDRIEQFYKQAAGPEQTPTYFVEKFLPYQVFPDLLSEIYAGARELVLVRDFRDMLSSILAFNQKRGYQAFGRERMESDAEYVTSLMKPSAEKLLRRWRDRGESAHLVRYEDLVSDPLGTLSELLRYLGLEAGEDMVRETLDRASGDEASGMDHHRTVSDPAASIGRWRSDLPAELAEVCNEALGPFLAEFGYEGATEKVADSAGA